MEKETNQKEAFAVKKLFNELLFRFTESQITVLTFYKK